MKGREKQSDWFETSVSDYLDPGFNGKKLKLIADAQMPKPVISEIVAAKIDLQVLLAPQVNASDLDVLTIAERRRRVLLTLDADFWDDRKHPIPCIYCEPELFT